VPAPKSLIKEANESGDAKRKEAAAKLQTRLDEVLISEDHRWSIGKMTPEEAAKRQKQAEEFKARYAK
jgi:hypothetical protein